MSMTMSFVNVNHVTDKIRVRAKLCQSKNFVSDPLNCHIVNHLSQMRSYKHGLPSSALPPPCLLVADAHVIQFLLCELL
jgi:hypothetical protein